MVCGRLPKGRPSVAGPLLLATLVSWVGVARADVELVPSADGYVGAFLVAGPLGSPPSAETLESVVPRDGDRTGPGLPGTWRVVSAGDGAINLAQELATGRPGAGALLAGVLEVDHEFDAWLLLSVDGAVTVSVDGNTAWSQTGKRWRGGSWDPVPLHLSEGRHQVVLLLEHPGVHWAIEMRWLDQKDLRPPLGARWILPGANPKRENALALKLSRMQLNTTIDARGFTPTLEVTHPRGAIAADRPSVRVQSRLAGSVRELRLGAVAVNRHGIQTLRATLPPLTAKALAPGTREQRFDVFVGGERHVAQLAVSAEAIEVATRAKRTLQRLEAGAGSEPVRSVLEATLDAHVHSLARASEQGRAYLLREAQLALARFLDAVDQDARFIFRPGIHHLAHYSELDGRPQGFWLHVPAGLDPNASRRYPAVLALHGYNGTPQGITQAFLDTHSDAPKAGIDGFVIAPEAHGNAFYRGPGEYEAMAALELVKELFPIDPERISVTGVSMGGTGAAELALRYSDTFAAAAPLCGYQSYFIRRDVQGRTIRPWETARMQHWSPASWADNGDHLPLYVAHGLRDHPLANSKVLIDAYKSRGFSVQEEWPDIGHAVWTISYKGARLWPWLSQKTRPTSPTAFTIFTDTLRYGKKYWARLEQFEHFGASASLAVKLSSPSTIEVVTKNVSRFELTPPLDPTAPTERRVTIDGEPIQLDSNASLEFVHRDRWQPGSVPQGTFEKLPGVEGPIRDAFLGPLVFVYGSLDPATRRANREVAEQFGRFHQGVTLEYPVLADRDLTPAVADDHSLVLVGTPADNLVLRRFAARLPIRAELGGLQIGKQSVRGPGVGAVFIHPNPEIPKRYVVVITGTDAAGIWRALSLPRLLPDFVIFDTNLRNAATQQVLGTASVLGAGFFDAHWSLPGEYLAAPTPTSQR